MRITLAAVGFLMSSTAALADPCEAPNQERGTQFGGQVTYVGDGDSLCVGPLTDKGVHAIEIRLSDFRAVELNDPGGREAKAALERIAFGKPIKCVALDTSWDRTVAACTLNGKPLGDLMRAAGVPEGGR